MTKSSQDCSESSKIDSQMYLLLFIQLFSYSTLEVEGINGWQSQVALISTGLKALHIFAFAATNKA